MRFFLVFTILLILNACSSKKNIRSQKPQTSKSVAKEVFVKPTKKTLKKVEKSIVETKKNAKSYLNTTTLNYIKQFAPLAMQEMQKFNIPASITLAQGILESGSGKSELAVKSKNHFGIKCHKGWKGDKAYHDDDAKGECFRKYKYAATSYQDHSLFLNTRFRYASLFKLKKDDYKGWAKGLKKAGYATDPKYPKKLISFIEKYELYKYDQMVLNRKVAYNAYTEKPTKKEVKQIVADLKKESKRRKKLNKKGIHIVKSEDTLYTIAKKYGISVAEIKAINHLSDSTIHKGDELKLWKDAKRKNYHTVAKKETLYSIAKKYNLSVNKLKQLNGLNNNHLFIGQALKIQ